jgi:Family of unknown function (DUF6159)
MDRGWRLTRAAWALMRRDPTMIYLALLGTGCAIAGTAIVFAAAGLFSHDPQSRAHIATAWLIALYPLTFVSVFFNVALAAAAGAHFEGRHLTLGEALRAAYDRIDRIALWALLTAGVGLLLAEIANRLPGGAKLAGWLMGAAWALATIFAIPLLALEDAGPIEALRGSAHLVKSRWGEGLTGTVGINAWTMIVTIPAAILIAIGASTVRAGRSPAAGVAMIAVGAVALVAAVALASATRQVFAVALFRYATDAPVGGFAEADLQYPFTLAKKSRRTRPWAWVALGLIVLAVAAAAIFAHPKSTHWRGSEGYSWAVFKAEPGLEAEVRDGMPVRFHGKRIGQVVEHRVEGDELIFVYFVDPRRRGIPGGDSIALHPGPEHPYLRLLPG